jgi:Holliday junction DNA helicase RuvB
MAERILDANPTNEDETIENNLRPYYLKDYVGQTRLKENLNVFISAALHRQEVLDHVLLFGPPGLGKTTLAFIIAHEMKGNILTIHGPSIEKPGDLAALLTTLKAGDILFIDEIHRLPRPVEEILYSAMEDFVLSIMLSRDGSGKMINIDLPPFTLIGATTRAGDLTAPLRARFGISEKLNYYTEEEICQIIMRTSHVLNAPIDENAAKEIARRSRGTPRIANRIFRRVRDFATYQKKEIIDLNAALSALNALHVDELGLDDVDIRYLKTLIERFGGGPVGLETLANAIGEEATNLEDVYEPYMLQLGLIDRTRNGRIASQSAYKHLKVNHNESLF